MTLDNGFKVWEFVSAQYIYATVKNVEDCLQKKGYKLPEKDHTDLPNGYCPNIYVTNS